MNQEERLNYLVEAFIKDSDAYQNLEVSEDASQNRRLLRSLMNVRLPRPMDGEILRIQDAYLQERNKEVGTITLDDIPTIEAQGSTHKYNAIFSIWQGDITRIVTDAIVNAANEQMLGCFIPMHTCIDNCIHTYAGVQLRLECHNKMEELRKIHGPNYTQPTSIPFITEGYNLPCKKVIHVVGPIVSHKLTKELEEDLYNCYWNVLECCKENQLRSIAFCCISTGVFCFPNQRAAELAVQACGDWLDKNRDGMDRIVFNVFKEEDLEIYQSLLL